MSECARAMQAVDWSNTAVGPVETWPTTLRTLVSTMLNSRHPMFLWWGADLVQFYNDAYRPSFGAGKHPQAMGQRGIACWPEIWPLISPQIRDVMERGIPSWHENQLVPIFRDGAVQEVYWSYGYSPVLDEHGKIRGTLVVCTETTQNVVSQRESERARLDADRAHARIRGLVQNAPAFVCTLNGPDHVFELINGHYERVVGLSRRLVGLSVRESLPEVAAQGFIELLDSVYRSGKPFVGTETPLQLDRLGNGKLEEAYVTFVYQPRRDAQGAVEGIDVFGFEVTDQVRARDELKRRTDFEEYLAAIVSHDLRNPLSAILMGTALLGRNPKLDPHAAKTTLRIQSAAERATRMINDLLDFTQARLGSGLPIVRRPANLHEICADLIEEVRGAHPEREITASYQGDGFGEWDPDRMAQVFTNLLTNALSYSPADSRVSLVSRDDGHNVTVEVHNRGEPIPDVTLATLFEPMKRGGRLLDRSTRSIGLGLFIVKEIVTRHGGTVAVTSSAAEGTTFRVQLPHRGP